MEIREPKTEKEWEEYYTLRYEVLRKPLNQPIGSERNEGDSIGLHFALFENEEIKAIARLDRVEDRISQVRFVAVLENQKGSGYGRTIMEAVEKKAIELGYREMILHARDYALAFYLKLGYENLGESYKLFGVLQHFEMRKKLTII